ncbi:MAG: response regulator [Acidobacteriota bacterium]
MQLVRTQQDTAKSRHLFDHPKVLLIDEDHRDRDHYRRMLNDNGFEVLTCSGFVEGADLLGTEKFDCIVVDQGGPDFRGRLVLEHSVAKDRYRPVVVLSRYHDMACYLEAMQLGAVDYLEKPLSSVEIVRVVTTHLQPRHAAA